MIQISALEDQEERERLKELFIQSLDTYFRERLKIDPSQLSDKSLKEFIPRNLMIDQNYIANWSINDYDRTVKPLIKNINTGRLDPLQFHKYLNRIYNDQTVVLDRDTVLEPICIGAKLDRVTFEGVRAMLLSIAGQGQAPFTFGELGEGVGTSSYGQQSLFDPVTARVEIKQENDGSMVLRGDTLFVTCSFAAGTTGFTQTEFGLFDSLDPADDKMFMYVQLDPTDQKAHVAGNDVPTFSSSVNVCTL
jgi:hypothetical protein